jgi:hypothetical protein
MTRRGIGLLVPLALLSLPFAAVAQLPGTIQRIGVRRLPAPSAPSIEAFRQGLHDLGSLAGQNLVIEYRYAEDHLERLPHLVADLIQLEWRSSWRWEGPRLGPLASGSPREPSAMESHASRYPSRGCAIALPGEPFDREA